MGIADSSISQSNIFGQVTSSSNTITPEGASAETTAAGKLIDHLKYVADRSVEQAANRAQWLGIAANQGQNTDPKGLIQGNLVPPAALDRSKAFVKWDLPAITASPMSLPSIPDNLKVDLVKL